jgi:hypothetical protein
MQPPPASGWESRTRAPTRISNYRQTSTSPSPSLYVAQAQATLIVPSGWISVTFPGSPRLSHLVCWDVAFRSIHRVKLARIRTVLPATRLCRSPRVRRARLYSPYAAAAASAAVGTIAAIVMLILDYGPSVLFDSHYPRTWARSGRILRDNATPHSCDARALGSGDCRQGPPQRASVTRLARRGRPQRRRETQPRLAHPTASDNFLLGFAKWTSSSTQPLRNKSLASLRRLTFVVGAPSAANYGYPRRGRRKSLKVRQPRVTEI